MRLGAFLITFNRPERLREALLGTLAQSRPPDRILVIDNGDPEPTRALVAEHDPRVVGYHAMGDNVGPAGASAYGLERLAGEGFDWILFGDDDTPPATPEALERLVELIGRAADYGVGGVGAVGARFDWRTGTLRRLADAELTGVVDVDGIGSGLQLMVRREVVARVGLPDRRLFFGFYDPEFCLRVRRAGLRLLVDGELMRAYRSRAGRLGIEVRRSLVPRTDPSEFWRRYYVTRNYIFMMRRTFGRPDLARREVGRAAVRLATSWLRGPRYATRFGRYQLRGVADGYRGRLGRTVLPEAKQYAEEVP